MLDPHGEIVALHAVEPAVVSTVECTVVRRRDVPCPVALMHELRDLVCRLLLEKKKAEGKLAHSMLDEPSLSDAQVDALIEQLQQAVKSRDFARADALREQLADA